MDTLRPRRALRVIAGVAITACVAACGSTSSSTAGGGKSGASGGDSAVADHPVNAALLAPFPSHPAPGAGNGGATDTGVTATSITTGSPIAASGALPGAQLGVWQGVQAYYKYVNDSGGIYGRKLISDRMETGFDAATAQAVCQNYIPKVFALNGTQSNVDAACYPLVHSSKIPWVGNWFDPQFAALPNVASPLPSTVIGKFPNTTCALLKQAFPSIKKVAILWINVAGIGPFVATDVACWKSVGVKTVYSVGTTPTTPSMTPYVIQARAKGADVVDAFAQDVTNAARIAQAMAQQSWHPTVAYVYAAYDATWEKLAGAGASGWEAVPPYGQSIFLDPDAMNRVKGGALFEKYWKIVNGSAPINVFSVEGWEQAAYFAQGIVNAGPKLTRQSLMTALTGITKWDNLGLTAPVQWVAPGIPLGNCGSLVEDTGGKYKQLIPDTQSIASVCTGKVLPN